MGGSSMSQPQPKPVAPADNGYYSVTPVMQTIQPLAPGHLDRIAAQMARGYGGMPDAYRERMNAVYKPVEILNYPVAHRAQAAARAAAAVQTPTPAAPTATSAPAHIGNPFVYDPGNWRGGPY